MIQFGPGPDGEWYVTFPGGFAGPVPAAKAIALAKHHGAKLGIDPQRVSFPSPPQPPKPAPTEIVEEASAAPAEPEPAPKKPRAKKAPVDAAPAEPAPEPAAE